MLFAFGVLVFCALTSALTYWLMNIVDRNDESFWRSASAFVGGYLSILLSASAALGSLTFAAGNVHMSNAVFSAIVVTCMITLPFAAAKLFRIADRTNNFGLTIVAGIWGFVCTLMLCGALFASAVMVVEKFAALS